MRAFRTEGVIPLSLDETWGLLHAHVDEDELSYVLEGEVGFRVGDMITVASPGTYVQKPRRIPHTFWNPTDRTARVMELLLPGSAAEGFRGVDVPGRKPNLHSDEWVRREVDRARRRARAHGSDIEIFAAAEGMELKLHI